MINMSAFSYIVTPEKVYNYIPTLQDNWILLGFGTKKMFPSATHYISCSACSANILCDINTIDEDEVRFFVQETQVKIAVETYKCELKATDVYEDTLYIPVGYTLLGFGLRRMFPRATHVVSRNNFNPHRVECVAPGVPRFFLKKNN